MVEIRIVELLNRIQRTLPCSFKVEVSATAISGETNLNAAYRELLSEYALRQAAGASIGMSGSAQ